MSASNLFAVEQMVTVRTSREVHHLLKRQAAMRELSLNRHCQELFIEGLVRNVYCRDALEVMEGYWQATREIELSCKREGALLCRLLAGQTALDVMEHVRKGGTTAGERETHHAGGPVPVPVS